MDFSTPQTFIMDWRLVVGVIGFFITSSAGLVYAFVGTRSMIVRRFDQNDAEFRAVRDDINAMKTRNSNADRETEAVKLKQSGLELSVAVMAEQMSGFARTLERIDRNVDGLVKGSKH